MQYTNSPHASRLARPAAPPSPSSQPSQRVFRQDAPLRYAPVSPGSSFARHDVATSATSAAYTSRLVLPSAHASPYTPVTGASRSFIDKDRDVYPTADAGIASPTDNLTQSPLNSWARRSADPPRTVRSSHDAGSAWRTSMPAASSPRIGAALPTLARRSLSARPTASAPAARAASQPELFHTPLRPAPPPSSSVDGWARVGGDARYIAELPLASQAEQEQLEPHPRQQQQQQQPRPEDSAAECAAVELVVSEFSVREVNLHAAKATVGPLVLRGALNATSQVFCTERVWPSPEMNYSAARQGGGPANYFAASWPTATVSDAVDLSSVAQNFDAYVNGDAAAPPRTAVFECYVLSSAGSSRLTAASAGAATAERQRAQPPPPPPPSSSLCASSPEYETFVGRSEVEVTELLDAAVQSSQTPSLVDVVLRDDAGSAVGRLSFAVLLRPLPRRTARVEAVTVLPNPLQAEDGYGSSGARDVRRRQQQPRAAAGGAAAAAFDGTLSLCLSAPPSADAQAEGPLVAADFCTAASVRWAALPPITFCETPATADASFLTGQLFYCPSRSYVDARRSQGMALAAERAPVLLGTFAIPPPPPGSASRPAQAPSPPSSASHGFTRPPSHTAAERYAFHVLLRTSAEGGRWMAMGDCWVRGVVETWAAPADVDVAAVRRAVERSRGDAPAMSAASPLLPGAAYAAAAQDNAEAVRTPNTRSRDGDSPAGSDREARMRVTTTMTASPPPPPVASSFSLQSVSTEDVALQRVRERQEALIQRVEGRLAEVQDQRRRLKEEMAAQAAQAAAEENAIVEEFGLLEGQQREAEAAYEAATAQLIDLQAMHAERTAHHEAYLAEQRHALEEVARERAEAVELRAQLEALQAQMKAHMAAEQQRYTTRVEQARSAMGKVEANARWLTEVEAKMAAAEAGF